MEDSARFLYMAGGILVGILILTLAIYLFTNFSKGATNVENQVAADQIQKFNSAYISYEGKKNITVYDIVNLARKARDYNKQNDFEKTDFPGHISVIIYDKKIVGHTYNNENDFIRDLDNIRNNRPIERGVDLTIVDSSEASAISDQELIDDYLVDRGIKEVYQQVDTEATPNPDPPYDIPKRYLPEYVCPSEGIILYPETGRVHYICFYKRNG